MTCKILLAIALRITIHNEKNTDSANHINSKNTNIMILRLFRAWVAVSCSSGCFGVWDGLGARVPG